MKAIYIGVNNIPTKVKDVYVGDGTTPRKVRQLYIGDNGTPKLIWEAVTLSAPLISITGDSLYMTDTSGLAQWFDIYVDGVKFDEIPALTFNDQGYNLSSCSKTAGQHSISVIARTESGYYSPHSDVLTYTMYAYAHRLDIIKYNFNDTLNFENKEINTTFEFRQDGLSFSPREYPSMVMTTIICNPDAKQLTFKSDSSTAVVYTNGKWASDAWKKITFNEKPIIGYELNAFLGKNGYTTK